MRVRALDPNVVKVRKERKRECDSCWGVRRGLQDGSQCLRKVSRVAFDAWYERGDLCVLKSQGVNVREDGKLVEAKAAKPLRSQV